MSGRVPEEVEGIVANEGSTTGKVWDAFHNIVIHPTCGVLWGLSDALRALGLHAASKRMARLGIRVHNLGWIPGSPLTHAQIAHIARGDIRDRTGY